MGLAQTRKLRLSAVGLADRLGNGVGRVCLAVRGKLQQRLLVRFLRQDAGNLELALGHSAGLVQDQRAQRREELQIVAALDQHAQL